MSRSRQRGGNRSTKVTGPATIPEGGFRLDEETASELIKFNTYLEAQRAIEAEERKIARAESAKDKAAANVRKLNDDPEASKEDKVAAEQAYKEAVAALESVKAGEEPDSTPADEPDEAQSEDAEPTPSDAAPTSEDPTGDPDESDPAESGPAESDPDESDPDESDPAESDAVESEAAEATAE